MLGHLNSNSVLLFFGGIFLRAGFWSAMASNLTNQSRNVLSKKVMVKKDVSLFATFESFWSVSSFKIYGQKKIIQNIIFATWYFYHYYIT